MPHLPAKPVVTIVDDPWRELGLQRPLVSLLPRLVSARDINRRHWRWSLSGAVFTVLVHFLMGVGMFSRIDGAWVANPIPNRAAAEAAPSAATDDKVMTVRFIAEDSSVERVDMAKLLMPSSIDEPPLLEPQVEMPPGIEPSPQQAIVQSIAGPGELPTARTPQDIYLDQIRARIDRAWNDSKGRRLALGKCRVGIRQANTGAVTGVEFIRCLSTEGWKQSLTQAIRYASPLPAPPEEKLFLEEIVLEF